MRGVQSMNRREAGCFVVSASVLLVAVVVIQQEVALSSRLSHLQRQSQLRILGLSSSLVRGQNEKGSLQKNPHGRIPSLPPISSPGNNVQNESNVRFLFVVGSEGTGHHFLLSLLEEFSPLRRMPKERKQLGQLIKLLWNEKKKDGLFNSHCSTINTDSENLLGSEAPIAAKMRGVKRMVQAQMAKKKIRGEVVLPLNLFENLRGVGMMSYPSWHGDCRTIAYPDLDVLYHACDEAQVECSHLLVYREPYAVIRSTVVNRRFDAVDRQIRMMGTMLGVILAQMLNQEQRRYWCWEYGKVEGWSEVGEAFGLEAQELSAGFDRIFNQSAGVAPSERDKIVPRHAQVHMQSLLLTTQRLQRMCARHHAPAIAEESEDVTAVSR